MVTIFINKKGFATVYLAISMVAILLFSALVVDVGMLTLNKSKIQNACDAAALAGAQELPDTSKAKAVAETYAKNNGVDTVAVTFSNSDRKITVAATDKPVNFFFARVIGINQGLVSAKASAVNAPISNGINGLRPFGLFSVDFKEGQSYTLKQDAGDGIGGNFQWLNLPNSALTGTNNILESNITYGNPNYYSVGDTIASVTGVATSVLTDVKTLYNSCTTGCTAGSHEENCPRIITVPILQKPATITGSTTFTIVGFAKFILTGLVQDGNGNGHIEVQGTFIGMVDAGGVDPSQTDYKLNGVRLSE